MEIIKNGFKNERLGIELDVYVIDEKEWFRAKDISEFLGYQDTNKMTRSIKITELNSIKQVLCTAQGNKYDALFINESVFSEIVQRTRKISKEAKEELLQSIGVSVLCTKETKFIGVLKEALSEINVVGVGQYNVDGYRIDFYIPKHNIAVEYDEQQHLIESNKIKDLERQKYIEDKLCCKFIRCDYRDSDIKNVMKVLKEVM